MGKQGYNRNISHPFCLGLLSRRFSVSFPQKVGYVFSFPGGGANFDTSPLQVAAFSSMNPDRVMKMQRVFFEFFGIPWTHPPLRMLARG